MDIFDTPYLRVNKLLISSVGLWPDQSSSNKNTFFFNIAILGVLVVFLPQAAFLLKHGNNLDDLYDVMPSFSGTFLIVMKVSSFHSKMKKFRQLVQHIRYDWCVLTDNKDIQIVMEYVKNGWMFTWAYLIFVYGGATIYVTVPLTVPLMDTIMGLNVTRSKQLPHASEVFVDLEENYYTLLIITYAGYVSCCTIVIAIDTMYFATLQHACAVFTILSQRLENLPTSNDKSKCIDRNLTSKWDEDVWNMVQCIWLQKRIDRLILLINETFSLSLFVDLGMGILFQCSSCVMIVTVMDMMEMMTNISLLILQSCRLYFNSWIGQRIIDHSSQLPIAAYNGMWYQTSLKAQKMLPFLIAKCQKPHRLTMAKLFEISLQSYSAIMRTSVSYVTVMISLNS